MDGEKLKRYRLEQGWSMRELGEVIGFRSSVITLWERGKRHPHPSTVKLIAERLGIPITYLLRSPQE